MVLFLYYFFGECLQLVSVRIPQLHAKRAGESFSLQRLLPALSTPAEISAAPGGLARRVDFDAALRRPDDAHEATLGARRAAGNAGAKWHVLDLRLDGLAHG